MLSCFELFKTNAILFDVLFSEKFANGLTQIAKNCSSSFDLSLCLSIKKFFESSIHLGRKNVCQKWPNKTKAMSVCLWMLWCEFWSSEYLFLCHWEICNRRLMLFLVGYDNDFCLTSVRIVFTIGSIITRC